MFSFFSCLCSEPQYVSNILLPHFCYFWIASLLFGSIRTGHRPKVNILLFMRIALVTACCLSYWWCCRCCSMLLLNLHAHKSCAPLLLLLHVYAVLLRLAVCRWTVAATACLLLELCALFFSSRLCSTFDEYPIFCYSFFVHFRFHSFVCILYVSGTGPK